MCGISRWVVSQHWRYLNMGGISRWQVTQGDWHLKMCGISRCVVSKGGWYVNMAGISRWQVTRGDWYLEMSGISRWLVSHDDWYLWKRIQVPVIRMQVVCYWKVFNVFALHIFRFLVMGSYNYIRLHLTQNIRLPWNIHHCKMPSAVAFYSTMCWLFTNQGCLVAGFITVHLPHLFSF